MIGGGAAGIFCAVNAARLLRQRGIADKVLVLERSHRLLSKVAVSGGGRCNVTHACFRIDEMIKRYPRGERFLRKAFYEWFTTDTVNWFAERGVELKTEPDGRMFPVTDRSQTIIDCLMNEANRYGVEIWTRAEVRAVEATESEDAGGKETDAGSGGAGATRFHVRLADGRSVEAGRVCIACGGYPRAPMFDWIRALGHTIESPVPSLFTFNMPGHPVTTLMGISVPDVSVRVASTKLAERGPLLITHWGMSGPAILRLSAWGARILAEGVEAGSGSGGDFAGTKAPYHFTLIVDWMPALNEQEKREELQMRRQEFGAQMVIARCPFALPSRLWEFLVIGAGIGESIRWADLPSREMNRLAQNLHAAPFAVKGKTTFKEEFVTAGGVKLTEVDPLTMQSRIVPGLYFAGEILDVDGVTGGFNFQHAWTSGAIAARSVVLDCR